MTAFRRQVVSIAVLGSQNGTGGFFPLGLSGPINGTAPSIGAVDTVPALPAAAPAPASAPGSAAGGPASSTTGTPASGAGTPSSAASPSTAPAPAPSSAYAAAASATVSTSLGHANAHGQIAGMLRTAMLFLARGLVTASCLGSNLPDMAILPVSLLFAAHWSADWHSVLHLQALVAGVASMLAVLV